MTELSKHAQDVIDFYHGTKNELVEAETFGYIAEIDIWQRSIRNGMDKILVGLCCKTAEDAEKYFNDAERNLRMARWEAWQRVAGKKILQLDDKLHSIRTSGNKDAAYDHLKTAQNDMRDARVAYSEDPMKGIEFAKKAASHARDGLNLLSTESSVNVIAMLFGVVGTLVAIVALALYFLK